MLPRPDSPHPALRLYVPSLEADGLLLQWWLALGQTGELDLTFGRSAQALSAFFGHFQEPNRLLYALHPATGAISMAMLLAPVMGASYATVWLDPTWRRQRTGLDVLEAAYEEALAAVPVLIGITRQPRLLGIHRRWGYDVFGRLPGVFDGHDGWVVVLTEEGYSRAKAAGRPRQPKEWRWERAADPARSTT